MCELINALATDCKHAYAVCMVCIARSSTWYTSYYVFGLGNKYIIYYNLVNVVSQQILLLYVTAATGNYETKTDFIILTYSLRYCNNVMWTAPSGEAINST